MVETDIYRPSRPSIDTNISSNEHSSVNGYGYEPSTSALSSSASIVEPLTALSLSPAAEFVLAMHDFEPVTPHAQCLPFRAGQVIHVLSKDTSGWWDGELDGQRGWFPSNYVSQDVRPLTEEPLPHSSNHLSTPSTASWTSVRDNNHTASSDPELASLSSSSSANHHEHLRPLVHGIHLLHNAVQNERTAHLDPSTACIISCVRQVLNSADCLTRNAPRLRQFPKLAQGRKRVLSELARLVSQTRKVSSNEITNEGERENEMTELMRIARQVFEHMSNFVVMVEQCGISIPDRRSNHSRSSHVASRISHSPSGSSSSIVNGQPASVNNKQWLQQPPRLRERTATPAMKKALTGRARSMSDLRSKRKAFAEENESEVSDDAQSRAQALRDRSNTRIARLINGRNEDETRFSNDDASPQSSLSSVQAYGFLSQPFPSGPANTQKILTATQSTHDGILSTIAAFIGHVHSHSRGAHASSAGHLIQLARETVDGVRELLALLDAISKHPQIEDTAQESFSDLYRSLYDVTNDLATAVRALTGTGSPHTLTEDEERNEVLRCATGVLRSGTECASAIKASLSQTQLDEPFIVEMPVPFAPRRASASFNAVSPTSPRSRRSASLSALRVQYEGEKSLVGEDHTITVADVTANEDDMLQPVPQAINGDKLRPSSSPQSSINDSFVGDDVSPRTSDEAERLRSVEQSHRPQISAETDDGRATWEGSLGRHATRALEDKLVNGDLPPVPRVPSKVDDGIFDDPSNWLAHSYDPRDVAYNNDGLLVGATLEVLVEKLTPHHMAADHQFSAVFMLTFRHYTTPIRFAQLIVARFVIEAPANLTDQEFDEWQRRKAMPIRLRVINVLRQWLEQHWRHETDAEVLPMLQAFTVDVAMPMFPKLTQRVLELIRQRAGESEGPISPIRDHFQTPLSATITATPQSPSEVPRPIMTKALLQALRGKAFASIVVMDFDVLELARQLTIMESTLYCRILPHEVLESGQEGASPAYGVKAITSLSNGITGWVSESILSEADLKKRTNLVKYFIKVADRCALLNNFASSRSILAALDSANILRLENTWNALPQKGRVQLESLRQLADHARNFSHYRSRLRDTLPPAVPFLGLYLTDVTFCRQGHPSYRPSPQASDVQLINFNKYHKLTRIIQDMRRFQTPYTLKEIPEVQHYLTFVTGNGRKGGNLQDLYRRSLLLEPRQPSDVTSPVSDAKQLFSWGSR